MDQETVELGALGFQALVTSLLAVLNLGLWRQEHRPYYLTWGAAWTLYVARLAAISAFLHTKQPAWLFVHQLATGGTALLLLWAALQFSHGVRFRPAYWWIVAAIPGWVALTLFAMPNYPVAGLSSAVALSAVTLWTAWVFFRHARQFRSTSATALGWTFLLWGLHHLDYPILRPLGSGLLFGVFADVLFIVAAAAGMVFLGAAQSRDAMRRRQGELEQLTRLLLRAQEDERRRIARDLHDEAGQLLTAAKIELDLLGHAGAGAVVGKALGRVRDVSNLLRPTALDDLGLVPALRSLVNDLAARARIEARFEASPALPRPAAEIEAAVYRIVQEALTNVARHARARSVRVALAALPGALTLVVEDDGIGAAARPVPHLGLLGVQERVSELAGSLAITTAPGAGFRLEATIPIGEAA